MKEVIFLRDYATLKKGDIKSFSRDLVSDLLRDGIAELYVKKTKKKSK